jgi:putative protease
MRKLELLAPAKNLECGIAAIDHGADAVYIGASRFGARASATNSGDDISVLCRYAHQFGAKVYVTVNTIIYDDETEQTCQLLNELSIIGVDAILVQDMAVLSLVEDSLKSDCHFSLHASTQTDNRSAEKVRWLRSLGFSRVVLARELTLDEIAAIHAAVPDVELEVFVHGALCVSYSGLCYASQYCFNRSANRGECAQFCRMKFDLLDADGNVLEHQRHLLSLKDMCQIDNLEQLAEAGASSFKIEGRLKDVGYVKNVVAAYSERLNAIVKRHPDKYCRASRGKCRYTFTPDLRRTFNRGYTTYFANGRQPNIASFDTPKAIGEYVGTVKEIKGRQSLTVAGSAVFVNGDGLCFVNDDRELEGFRVNRVENNRLYPLKMPASLKKGMRLYRNNDLQFERILSKPSAERKIPVSMKLRASSAGFLLSIDDVEVDMPLEHQKAQKSQRDNIVHQLTKLGDTPYECTAIDIPENFDYFIPGSRLSELRRMAVKAYAASMKAESELHVEKADAEQVDVPVYRQSYCYNVSNKLADKFYASHGMKPVQPAFELRTPQHPLIMQCRHCLRYSLGYCVKNGGHVPSWHEPLSLRLGDGRLFRLEFDCRNCQMNIYGV